MKNVLALFLMIVIISLSGCAFKEQAGAVDPNDTSEILFEVPSGSSTKKIAVLLVDNGLIKSDWAFVQSVKELELDGKLQAGKYKLSKSMDVQTIAKVIASGKVYEDTFKFTIPEGYEFEKIVKKLSDDGIIDSGKFIELAQTHEFSYEFLQNLSQRKFRLEGYLFPATYTFKKGADELTILTAMLEKFNSVYKKEYYARALELNMTVDQIITLASIIEREGASSEEFPIISGVFHNRLNKKMLLQSCATVQYIINERKPVLSNKDIAIDSPYNTYKNAGLPPAPIAAPGEVAIKAALYPEKTDYLYFVVSGKNDGKHIFSKTLAEHERAVKKALK